MNEKRRFSREAAPQKLPLHITIKGALEDQYLTALLVDYSDWGAQFITDDEMRTGAEILIEPTNADLSFMQKERATVIWVVNENGHCRFGCSFNSFDDLTEF